MEVGHSFTQENMENGDLNELKLWHDGLTVLTNQNGHVATTWGIQSPIIGQV
jgi:hypothetical protein